jgi:hypothetical protein
VLCALTTSLSADALLPKQVGLKSDQDIYHAGWIDFNKNGKKDVFEDPTQPQEKRVEDLLAQMNVDEKTCQLATLYGYRRVLKDPLPTSKWKEEIMKFITVVSACVIAAACSAGIGAEAPIPPVPDKEPEPPFPKSAANAGVQMLVPGFTVRELPVKLTSLNNMEYAPDGRLFAGGYDGRFHLLRDTDGDGLEDRVDTFSPEPSANYPLGMAVKDGEPYAVLTDEVVRWRDTNGDGVPDTRETVVKGFDDPALVTAPYLNHRRVDSSMAIAFSPDGALLVTMGNAGFNNAYWHDKQGVAHYSPEKRRGCLLRISPE